MGVSSKKTTSTQTTTPNNPSWVTDSVQGLVGQINGLGGMDPSSFVAGASPLQQQAFQQAGNLGLSGNYGAATGAIATANSATTPLIGEIEVGGGRGFNAASLLEGLQDYINPQLQGVVDPTLASFDDSAGRARAAAAAKGAMNNAFGGSRYAIGESQLNADLERQRALTEGQLRYDAFDKAYNYSNLDAGRRQEANRYAAEAQNARDLEQARINLERGRYNADSQNRVIDRYLESAGLLGQLASAEDTSRRANIGLLGDLGEVERGIAQDYATAPLSLLQAQQSLLSGLPLELFRTEQTTKTGTENPSLLGGIGKAAGTAAAVAGLFSDRRLKRNIKPLGVRDGLKWYSYNYVWGGPRHEGVMADEVQKVKPEAVTRHESGFLMVNYGAL